MRMIVFSIVYKLLALLLMLAVSIDIQAACSTACSTNCNIAAHTTFVPRRMSQNSVLELSLYNYRRYHGNFLDQECPPWVDVQLVAPYAFGSTNRQNQAEYFLPGGKQNIIIAQNNTSDVSSPWLELLRPMNSPYVSSLTLAPKRTVIGGALRLVFGAYKLIEDDCWYKNIWATVFIPIQQVRHSTGIKESIATGSGTSLFSPGIHDAIDALNNPAWNYGKISPNTRTKAGIDDISVKLGWDAVTQERGHVAFYSQFFIPTGKGTKAHYLFEPLVGSDHWGIGGGLNADMAVWQNDCASVYLMFDARYAYFLKHKEWRSIDLFNGDWSRYLLVATPTAQTTPLPGINYMTQHVSVTPRSMFEAWAALSFATEKWDIELGYDFWIRAQEKIRLKDIPNLGVGIFDFGANPDAGICVISAHCAKICAAIPSQPNGPIHDDTFTPLQNSEAVNKQGTTKASSCNTARCSTAAQCSYLNLDSAAHPRALSSMVYAAISRECCFGDGHITVIGVGGSYEIAHRNSALSQYGVWFKTAINF